MGVIAALLGYCAASEPANRAGADRAICQPRPERLVRAQRGDCRASDCAQGDLLKPMRCPPSFSALTAGRKKSRPALHWVCVVRPTCASGTARSITA